MSEQLNILKIQMNVFTIQVPMCSVYAIINYLSYLPSATHYTKVQSYILYLNALHRPYSPSVEISRIKESSMIQSFSIFSFLNRRCAKKKKRYLDL